MDQPGKASSSNNNSKTNNTSNNNVHKDWNNVEEYLWMRFANGFYQNPQENNNYDNHDGSDLYLMLENNDNNNNNNISIEENSMPLVAIDDSDQSLHNNNTEANNTNGFESFDCEKVPPGYRFVPTDKEIMQYLEQKIDGLRPLPRGLIHEVDVYQCHPQQLTKNYRLIGIKEWYFFTKRKRKYSNGGRPDRTAGRGYWKPTGTGKNILKENICIGTRLSLDYYEYDDHGKIKNRKQSDDKRTDWKMHEYKKDNEIDKFVLCKIYPKMASNRNINNGDEIGEENGRAN